MFTQLYRKLHIFMIYYKFLRFLSNSLVVYTFTQQAKRPLFNPEKRHRSLGVCVRTGIKREALTALAKSSQKQLFFPGIHRLQLTDYYKWYLLHCFLALCFYCSSFAYFSLFRIIHVYILSLALSETSSYSSVLLLFKPFSF